MTSPQHIGIVGCSAEGAALCYRTICREASRWLGPHAHPEVSMHTPSLATYVHALERSDMEAVAALMLDSARKLAAAGADFLICPDNTIHQAFDLAVSLSPLPWMHIAEVVAEEAQSSGFQQLGITGTRWLVESDVYPLKLEARGLGWLRPAEDDRIRMGQIIMDELVPGDIQPTSVQWFRDLIGRFAGQGCDAVVLGCTEIPLIIHDGNSSLPTLDSTRLLARAALRRALAPPASPRGTRQAGFPSAL